MRQHSQKAKDRARELLGEGLSYKKITQVIKEELGEVIHQATIGWWRKKWILPLRRVPYKKRVVTPVEPEEVRGNVLAEILLLAGQVQKLIYRAIEEGDIKGAQVLLRVKQELEEVI